MGASRVPNTNALHAYHNKSIRRLLWPAKHTVSPSLWVIKNNWCKKTICFLGNTHSHKIVVGKDIQSDNLFHGSITPQLIFRRKTASTDYIFCPSVFVHFLSVRSEHLMLFGAFFLAPKIMFIFIWSCQLSSTDDTNLACPLWAPNALWSIFLAPKIMLIFIRQQSCQLSSTEMTTQILSAHSERLMLFGAFFWYQRLCLFSFDNNLVSWDLLMTQIFSVHYERQMLFGAFFWLQRLSCLPTMSA